MIRLTITLAAVLLLSPYASAAVTAEGAGKKKTLSELPPSPRKSEPRTARVVPPPAQPPADELQLTTRSEIYLDGQPVKYSAIPRSARVTHVEVAPNGRTILKIQFRSR